MARTLSELAKEALEIQNACNLSGLVFSFAKMMEDLCEHIKNIDDRNHHPIITVWLNKLNSLNDEYTYILSINENVKEAFNKCYDLAEEKKL